MTLFDRVFGGNDYNYGRTVAAIDEAIAKYGEAEPVAFPATAYNLPCYYSITGKKVGNLGELKPKRLRLMRHHPGANISMILLQCRKGAKPGLIWEDQYLYEKDGTPSEHFVRIYHLQEA